MSHTVYIVHCIDTEGPLYQGKGVPFEMLKNVFGITLKPDLKTLEKLRAKQINLNGQEEAVSRLLDDHLNNTLGSWDAISHMLDRITNRSFRNKFVDSNGDGWIYNWFCMDHVGFTGANPRRRIAGHHSIFDFYTELTSMQGESDIVQFHHHPLPFSGNYNDSATAFWGRSTLNDILARKIIDRHWFPCAFRPGFHAERPDSNWFLEQWIPFDYANQSIKGPETLQPDSSNGRFGDWRRAPKEWTVYHPSHDDYQQEGNCRRWIARCLNMRARLRQIEIEDVRDAFNRAVTTGDTLLSFTNHDFRDMEIEIERVRDMIKRVSEEYPYVRFEYADAVNGMRKVLGLDKCYVALKAELVNTQGAVLSVQSSESIFGPQPFLAIKTLDGVYVWDNFDFQGNNQWTYVFDNHTIALQSVDKIGIAANSSYGITEVIVMDVKSQTQEKFVINSD